jgi:hypothetical protein
MNGPRISAGLSNSASGAYRPAFLKELLSIRAVDKADGKRALEVFEFPQRDDIALPGGACGIALFSHRHCLI